MPIRRSADPATVTKIWNAICYLSQQQQNVDAAKVIKYLQVKNNCSVEQAELYIKQTLKDGLITASVPNGRASAQKSFDTSQILKITTQELPELDGKDWYCFECHLAGDVNECRNCYRVYHSDCINNVKRKFEQQRKANENLDAGPISETNEENTVHSSTKDIRNYVYDEALCSVCNMAAIDDCELDKAEMNYLLKFVLHRIRSWLPTILTHTMAEEDRPEWLTEGELSWRANQLFAEHRDMSVIEVKINSETYTKLSEFMADVLTVQHNVAVFHGIESQEFGAADLMLRDTIHDITELKNCPDCYRHSNEKINNKWFCLPCRKPHELVWAKQKGYPYWPAKIIRRTSTHYDVRFFGGKYERALLPKNLIKPISTPKAQLSIKSSSAFTRAYEELQLHQRLLNDPEELEKFKADSKPRKLKPLPKIKPLASTPKKMATPKKSPVNGNAAQKRKAPEKEVAVKKQKVEEQPLPIRTQPPLPVSDEDESAEYSFRDNSDVYNFDEANEQVTSSTENFRRSEIQSPSRENGMQQLDHPYSDSVEKMRRRLECLTDKKDLIKCAMECMQTEIDRLVNDHNDHLKRLFEAHNQQISETKKKQWCYNCEQDAIYHCCWNTAYCSQICQQQHWQAEHKKVCRRKR